ncbi:MAG TPA: protein-L-isoaspartate(D-aspartate) O-methyltransferase [Hyphomicrobiaceae bacterium]|nr:protein-L-isoaspartate(D-aspartate) O-methyltransferase [Hyphomicrobiaceae bacterium]
MLSKGFNFAKARCDLVAEIKSEAEQFSKKIRDAIAWPGVLDTIASVPRERFVDQGDRRVAYRNVPLPIGCGQTISQPFIVALMSGALQPRVGCRVLEIGTGSGYQAAVLARLVGEVFSIEIVGELAERAEAVLAGLGVNNVVVRVGDGHDGWPEAAPFDGIIVTAASEDVPYRLVEQLKPGGRLVVPLGRTWQMLAVLTQDQAGNVCRDDLLPVRFVPFVAGLHGAGSI